jgi:hypothetical protein
MQLLRGNVLCCQALLPLYGAHFRRRDASHLRTKRPFLSHVGAEHFREAGHNKFEAMLSVGMDEISYGF